MKQQRGFTLVELAIVLVIIGLILGMAFKGKDLIDGAKVKSLASQYNKMQAGFNTYYDKYGAYPGDGCAAVVAVGGAAPVTTCAAGATRNGILAGVAETESSTALLQNTNILTTAELQNMFGSRWGITNNAQGAPFVAGVNYMVPTTTAVGTAAVSTAVDARFVCALDHLIDDGIAATGNLRSNGAYVRATDCWGTAGVGAGATGLATMGLRILP